uniref:MarR family transcriptional regulator n=1 Tax=Steinernema glaseri TaxID=37863 RepID=A0A1I7ZIA3_9BILA
MRRWAGCTAYLEDVLGTLDRQQVHWAFYSFREDSWDGMDYELGSAKRLDQPSISVLAESMGLDRSTLGRNVRVLEADGLVALAEGVDLRNRIVLLTE